MNSGRTVVVENGSRRSAAATVARGARQTLGAAVTVVGSVGCVAGRLLDRTGTGLDPAPGPPPRDPRKPLAPPAPMGLLDAVRPVVRAVCSRSRRSWTNEERAHLELRVLDPAELADLAARLEAALAALDAVHWVEVNGYLGRVVVAFDAEALTVADLVAVVETVEAAGGYAERPFPSEIGTHPGDVEPLLREAAKVGADIVSLAVAFPLRFLKPMTGPVRPLAAPAVAVINGVPTIPGAIEARFPSPVTHVTLAVVNTLVQGIGMGPLAPLTELAHPLQGLVELQAQAGAG